jgi:predicted MFS family arabinose efflux permease
VLEPGWLDMLVSLPLAMLVGAITASLGTVLGDIWNWNER